MGKRARRDAAEIERFSATLPFALSSVFQGDDDEFRIRGWMNTFRVTSSGRMLDPRDFARWLERRDESETIPMLVNHGFEVSPGPATIGQWDRFEFDPQRGMLWEGWVASGTRLAEDVRTLLAQKALRQLSVRVNPGARRRLVGADEADLPETIRQAIRESGAERVMLFQDWYPLEGSIVDVADDLGARIAASAGAGLDDAALGDLLPAELSERAPHLAEFLHESLADVGAKMQAAGTQAGALEAVRGFATAFATFNSLVNNGAAIERAERELAEGERHGELLDDDAGTCGCAHGDDDASAAADDDEDDDDAGMLSELRAGIEAFGRSGGN